MDTMKFLFIVVLGAFIHLLNINAQSAKSDELYNKALRFYENRDYGEAAKYFKQAYVEDRNNMDTLSFRRYNSEMWMNHCLFLVKEGTILLPYYSKCQPVNRVETYDVDSILTQAKALSEKWKYDTALDEYVRATTIVKEKWGENNQLYAYCLMNYYDCISTISVLNGNNISAKYEAVKIANILLDLYDRDYFIVDEHYYSIIQDLSLNYQRLGQFRQSLEVLKYGIYHFKSKGFDSEKWIVKFWKDASFAYFRYFSQYGFDPEIAQDAISIGRDIEDYYNSKAKYVQRDSLDYIDTKRINVIDYVRNMYYLSYYGYFLHEYNYAKEKAQDGIRELSRFPDGNENQWYALLFNNYALALEQMNDIKTALKLEHQLYTYYTLRNKHRQYDTEIEGTIKNLVYLFEKVNEIDSVAYYAQQYYACFNKKARSMYFDYTNNIISYWNNELNYIEDLCRFASKYNKTTLPAILYNILLISKGYLLEGENTIPQIVKFCGDTLLQNKYNKLLSAKENSQRTTPSIMQLEEEIRSECLRYYNFEQLNYQTVLKKLDEKSAAVEFFYYKDNDSIYYNALLIKKNVGTPLLIKCFSFEEKNNSILTNDEESCKLVWKNITNCCDGIENIYFVPAGILQTLPIENLPLWDENGLICDSYHLYRLTSTREIVKKKSLMPNSSQYALFGGLYYDEYSEQDDLDSKSDRKREALDCIQYLPGSKNEVESICKLIKNKNRKVAVLSGYKGTTQAFRDLAVTPHKVIHLATHGFFNMDEMKKKIDFGSHLTTETNKERLDEEFVLSHSGLYLSTPNKHEPKDSIIITAKDISQMNFDELDMVVLSACETAQGVNNLDGVFGIQRGFKKAGAQSILMSLWKVDDEATCLLMTEFYKNWIGKGKTKHDALELAEQTVRSHKEKGWDDPKYWAAFILLDALD